MIPAPVTVCGVQTGALRIGSLCIHVDATSAIYLEDLSAIYCTALIDPGTAPAAGLHLTIVESPDLASVAVPADGMILTPNGEMHTEAMLAQTALDGDNPRAKFSVIAENLSADERRIYLVVLLNKILFRLGCIRLHASAVSLDDKVSVFIGDRGAGKSSTCAFLAGQGALILADDDVLMKYDGNSCAVSGCDETMRIMADAELRLFGGLNVPVQLFGGVPKKQIATAERFATEPYVDHGLDRMFFSSVGERFSVRRLTPGHVVMRLMSTLIPSNRFAGASDHEQTLDYLAGVAGRVTAYELTLSRDFKGLDCLLAFLKGDGN